MKFKPKKLSPEQMANIPILAASKGWTDVLERHNGRGKLLGYMGKPPGYVGPYVNIYIERLEMEYSLPSYGDKITVTKN